MSLSRAPERQRNEPGRTVCECVYHDKLPLRRSLGQNQAHLEKVCEKNAEDFVEG